jgi:hypothetical protein
MARTVQGCRSRDRRQIAQTVITPHALLAANAEPGKCVTPEDE